MKRYKKDEDYTRFHTLRFLFDGRGVEENAEGGVKRHVTSQNICIFVHVHNLHYHHYYYYYHYYFDINIRISSLLYKIVFIKKLIFFFLIHFVVVVVVVVVLTVGFTF